MNNWVLTVIAIAISCRLLTLLISRCNESLLRSRGAQEYGAANSRWLAIAHTVFYLACGAEGHATHASPSASGVAGAATWCVAMLALLLVIVELRGVWNVRVLLEPGRGVMAGVHYRNWRRVNYLLAIVPELIGLALALQAWITLIVGLPIYLAVLRRRMAIERQAIEASFPGDR